MADAHEHEHEQQHTATYWRERFEAKEQAYNELYKDYTDFQTSSAQIEAELEQETQALHKQLHETKIKLERTQSALDQVRDQLAVAQHTSTDTIASLQRRLGDTGEQLHKLSDFNRRLEQEKDDLERHIRIYEAQVDDLTEKLHNQIEDNVLLQSDLEVAQTRTEFMAERIREEIRDGHHHDAVVLRRATRGMSVGSADESSIGGDDILRVGGGERVGGRPVSASFAESDLDSTAPFGGLGPSTSGGVGSSSNGARLPPSASGVRRPSSSGRDDVVSNSSGDVILDPWTAASMRVRSATAPTSRSRSSSLKHGHLNEYELAHAAVEQKRMREREAAAGGAGASDSSAGATASSSSSSVGSSLPILSVEPAVPSSSSGADIDINEDLYMPPPRFPPPSRHYRSSNGKFSCSEFLASCLACCMPWRANSSSSSSYSSGGGGGGGGSNSGMGLYGSNSTSYGAHRGQSNKHRWGVKRDSRQYDVPLLSATSSVNTSSVWSKERRRSSGPNMPHRHHTSISMQTYHTNMVGPSLHDPRQQHLQVPGAGVANALAGGGGRPRALSRDAGSSKAPSASASGVGGGNGGGVSRSGHSHTLSSVSVDSAVSVGSSSSPSSSSSSSSKPTSTLSPAAPPGTTTAQNNGGVQTDVSDSSSVGTRWRHSSGADTSSSDFGGGGSSSSPNVLPVTPQNTVRSFDGPISTTFVLLS